MPIDNAAQAFFGIPELVQQVLRHLPQSALVGVVRVNQCVAAAAVRQIFVRPTINGREAVLGFSTALRQDPDRAVFIRSLIMHDVALIDPFTPNGGSAERPIALEAERSPMSDQYRYWRFPNCLEASWTPSKAGGANRGICATALGDILAFLAIATPSLHRLSVHKYFELGTCVARPPLLRSLSLSYFWFGWGNTTRSSHDPPGSFWNTFADSLERLELTKAKADSTVNFLSLHLLRRLEYLKHDITYHNHLRAPLGSSLPRQLRYLDLSSTKTSDFCDNQSGMPSHLEALRLRILFYRGHPAFTNIYLDALRSGLENGVYPALRRLDLIIDITSPLAEYRATEARLEYLRLLAEGIGIVCRVDMEDRDFDYERMEFVGAGSRWYDQPLDIDL